MLRKTELMFFKIFNISNVSSPEQYVGPPYCQAEMYVGRITLCPLVIHGEYADGTGRQTDLRTDARPLQYSFT